MLIANLTPPGVRLTAQGKIAPKPIAGSVAGVALGLDVHWAKGDVDASGALQDAVDTALENSLGTVTLAHGTYLLLKPIVVAIRPGQSLRLVG